MSIYKRDFDKTRSMYILIKEDNFFDKYIEILEKVSNSTTKEFNSTLGYNKTYLKAEKKEGIQ